MSETRKLAAFFVADAVGYGRLAGAALSPTFVAAKLSQLGNIVATAPRRVSRRRMWPGGFGLGF